MNVTDLDLDDLDTLDAMVALADRLGDDDRPDVSAAAANVGRAARRLLDALLADLMVAPRPILPLWVINPRQQASQGN